MARSAKLSKGLHEPDIPNDYFRIKKIQQLLNKQSPKRRAALMGALENKQLFITTKQFSERLGIQEQKARRWLRKRIIKGKKVAGTWLVRADEIDRLMAENDE